MKTLKLSTVLAGAMLLAGVASTACVADRPSRNSVFNENQYLRKDFLVSGVDPNGESTDPSRQDPGWMVRATVTETATPNLVGNPQTFGVFPGATSEVELVRFRVTSDKLQMLDQIQFSTPQNPGQDTGSSPNFTGVTEAIVNAWSATNVDLKYQVNLDGEKTNSYIEDQELDWQVRQWVKLSFDKNDFSDLQPLGPNTTGMIGQCAQIADASATLVDGSFNVEGADTADISDDYFEFTVQVAMPMNVTGADVGGTANPCLTAYGAMLPNALRIGRTTATVNLKYSFKRATPTSALTYKPFMLAEKDPIHTKYGPWLQTVWNRDPVSELVAANQYVIRWDPQKQITWYFDQGFPEYYKPMFTQAGGIADATNKVFATTNNPIKVQFLNYNDQSKLGDAAGPARQFGDVRYNILRWVSDQDTEDLFAGDTPDGIDPRTGEIVHGMITFNDFAVRDYYVQRIDAFLQTVGASSGLGSANCAPGQNGPNCWNVGSCTTGQTRPIVNQTIIDNHNANDTLFTKMQSYLNLHGPNPNDDHLGPQDFTANAVEDSDFYNAYFTLVPYEIFQDPDANLFVTREGGQGVYGAPGNPSPQMDLWNLIQKEANFQALSAQISNGVDPTGSGNAVGTDSVLSRVAFANNMRQATLDHEQYKYYTAINSGMTMDAPSAFSFETVMEQDSQECVNGTWQTQAQWTQAIIDSYWQQVFWHEFGHSLGLSHQFMGNIDQLNFTPQVDSTGKQLVDGNNNPLYQEYSSSVMEYNAAPARLAWQPNWGTYDQGAIAFMYANDSRLPDDPAKDMAAAATLSRSGELPGTTAGQEYPYKDPLGFCAAGSVGCPAPTLTKIPNTGRVERAFIRCDDTMTKYTPLCRQGDLGITPSQIIANSIDDYEWQFQWRNFRDYRKVWDASAYASEVAGYIMDQRRFLSQWAFDWSPGEIATLLYRVGVTPNAKAGAISSQDYYAQLTYKFLVEMSKTNQMVGSFAEAIMQQSAGERPYATVYDKFYGDVTQQGIILDKYYAMQNWVGLWISDNYDQNQAGAYLSSWSSIDYDATYQAVAETAVSSMIGAQYVNAYPYFTPTSVALFAQDTHNPAFLSGSGRIETKEWIGGWTFGGQGLDPWQPLITFFKNLAVQSSLCDTVDTCPYDVTDPNQVAQSIVNGQFIGPDGLNYVYAYLPMRNEVVLAREDRNIVTWKLILTYNSDVIGVHDDGSNGTYGLEYPIEYTIDSYNTFESGNPVPMSSSSSSSTSGG
jgi:hypothetical protein